MNLFRGSGGSFMEEERWGESVLPVLRRIKNATLSDSLQGGHRLIEMMFMFIVVEYHTMNLCPYLYLEQSGVWSLSERKSATFDLCKKLTFTRLSKHLNTREANGLGTGDSHHQLITIRRPIQSQLQLPKRTGTTWTSSSMLYERWKLEVLLCRVLWNILSHMQAERTHLTA